MIRFRDFKLTGAPPLLSWVVRRRSQHTGAHSLTNSIGIVAAGNTYNPCLLILGQKGFRLHAEESGKGVIWTATKAEASFLAYSPPELLGIVTLWECFGQDWNQQEPNILGQVLESDAEQSAAPDGDERS